MCNLFALKGKTALITGGGSGIGQAITVSLSGAGVNVVLVGRNKKKLENTVKIIEKNKKKNAQTLIFPADVTELRDVNDVVSRTTEKFGCIDILINNAGVNIKKEFLEITVEEWKKIIEINLTGQFIVAQAAAKQMVKQMGGKIINMASVGGFMALSKTAPYCASKGGVIQLTKVMAADLSKYNINVNSISPGFIMTDLLKDSNQKEKIIDTVKANTLLRRPGYPSDLIGTVFYLASDASKYITGTNVVIDGGMSVLAI